jgi:uncharacterized protein YqcC (DUF446 family)
MERTALQEAVAAKLEAIEAEMRACGFWQNRLPTPKQLQFSEAFAMDTMTFVQWLQFVFIPNVREAVEENSFPESSSVAAQAVREFDTVPEANRLTSLLSEFDALF